MKLKYYAFGILLIISFYSCSRSIDDEVLAKKEILSLLNKNANCYKSKDINCIMSTFAKDTSTVALGAQESFKGYGYDEIEKLYTRDFKMGWEMKEYKYIHPKIFVSGNIAWLTSEVKSKVAFKQFKININSRLTAICKKINNNWKLIFVNFQRFSEVPTKQNGDKKK